MTTGIGPYVSTSSPSDIDPSGTVVDTTLVASIETVDIGGVMVQAEVYNGAIPGPTFQLNVGDTVIVRLVNNLPHPTGIHWHGIELQNAADGTPVTQGGAMVGPFPQPVPESPSGGTYLYKFKVTRPGIFWYHPHHHHSTNRVFRGLYGMMIVTDPNEFALVASNTIPGPADTMQVVLSDITVCKAPGSNDSQTYQGLAGAEWLSGVTVQPGPSPEDLCELSPLADDGNAGVAFAAGAVPNIQRATPGRTVEGQTVLTNGVNVGGRAGTPSAPGALSGSAVTHAVQSGQGLRLQFVNCATSRYFRLVLTTQAGAPVPLVRIGGEGGLLNRAVQEGGTLPGGLDTGYFAGEILIPPASRADVVAVIPPGASIGDVLTLWTRDFQRTGPVNPGNWAVLPTVPVMHLDVTGPSASPLTIVGGDGNATGTLLRGVIPGQEVETLGPFPDSLLDPSTFVPPKPGTTGSPEDLHDIQLTAGGGAGINGVVGSFSGFEPYTTTPHIASSRYAEVGQTLQLMVSNTSSAHHPFHLHGFSFQPISLSGPGGSFVWPYPEFVDVINIPAGQMLTFGLRLEDRELADGITMGGALGRWLFHCHIFFHAHSGMISELVVTNSAGGRGSEKPNVDVGGSWAYTPAGGVAERRGSFFHPDGDPVALSASLGAVTDTGGGTWHWTLDSTGLPDQIQYVYITATDANGRQDQTVFRLKIGGDDEGSDTGDPHIRTVDGTRYDFQAVGEFTLLRDREGMEVQVRQTPVTTASPITDSYTGLKSCVSVNTAVAARIGRHHISYQPTEQAGRLQFFVNGKPHRLTPEGVEFDGHRVSAFDADGGVGLRIDYAHHPVVTVTPHFWNKNKIWYMDVDIAHTQADAGLMGPIAPGSWLPALRNGASVGPMPKSFHERYVTLYQTFANSWRLDDETSLFVYAPGTSTATFTDANWPAEQPPCKLKPQFEIPGVPPPVSISIPEAQQICHAVTEDDLHADCVFDVATTGDEVFAKGYLFAQELRRRGTKVQIIGNRPFTQLGESLLVTAIVLPLGRNRAMPTGTVTFFVDGAKAGPPVKVDSSGRAQFKLDDLSQGTRAIRAAFNTDKPKGLHSSSSPTLHHEVRNSCGDLAEPVDVRVVLEKIEILDDRDCLGKGEVWFEARVLSSYGGDKDSFLRLPPTGYYHVSDKPGKNVIDIETEVFRGVVHRDLAIQVRGGEADWFTRNDPLGVYTRTFRGDPAQWIGRYLPDDESLDPEGVGLWRITYRIERQ